MDSPSFSALAVENYPILEIKGLGAQTIKNYRILETRLVRCEHVGLIICLCLSRYVEPCRFVLFSLLLFFPINLFGKHQGSNHLVLVLASLKTIQLSKLKVLMFEFYPFSKQDMRIVVLPPDRALCGAEPRSWSR